MNGIHEAQMCADAPIANPFIGIENVKPCIKCGATDRNVSGQCRPCKNAYEKKWNSTNPERVKTSRARYRTDHREQVNAYRTKYRTEHAEQIKVSDAKYRSEHFNQARDYGARYRTENPEKIKANSAKYGAEHAEQIKASGVKYRASHLGKAREYNVKWNADHPERAMAKNAKYYTEHAKQIRENSVKWQTEHPENKRASAHRRRARKLKAGGSFTAENIKSMLKKQRGRKYMNNILWIVKRKLHKGYDYPFTCETRSEARMIAAYYNGFSHRTKHARYRVKKYLEEVGK